MNSGEANSIASASAGFGHAVNAARVDAEHSGPSVASATACAVGAPGREACVIAQSARFSSPSPDSQASAVSGHPFGSSGPMNGWPRSRVASSQGMPWQRRQVERPEHRYHVFSRGAEFRERQPRFRHIEDSEHRLLQVAPGAAKVLGHPSHAGGRRSVGDEMADELGGDVAIGRGMGADEIQRVLAALEVSRKGVTHEALGTRFVRISLEHEAAVVPIIFHRPPGEDRGEDGHVTLRVAAVDAKRVKFEAFTGKIFVQATVQLKA